MFNYKATTYQPMEKPKQEKKFKQNSYEEIRKLVEDNAGNDAVASLGRSRNDTVKEVKKNKKNNKEISYKFKLFD